MLLNPKAVERLKSVTEFTTYWSSPYRTHAQRNELARMFIEEAGRLLDQKAESSIKHFVELYCKGDLSYEQYSECIEQVSKEEEIRGSALGGAYARNHVFDVAQKALDHENDRRHALAVTEAKKQYEVERQKANQVLNVTIQQGLAEITTATQQYEDEKNKQAQALQDLAEQKLNDLRGMTSTQQKQLLLQHEQLIEQTKTEVDQIVATRLYEERQEREREIYEQEELRPVREAARAATHRITLQEKQVQRHTRLKIGIAVLDFLLFLVLMSMLLFLSIPQWISAVLLVLIAALVFVVALWKSSVSDQSLTHDKKEIELFQTKSGDYAPLSEEERCTLLVKRIG